MTNSYEIKTKKLENGNGYIYATVINGCEHWERPNQDIGETYENQLGFSKESDAILAAAKCIVQELRGAEQYEQHEENLLRYEQ